jgi:hypothetical protein
MSSTRDVNRRSCSQSHCAMIRQRAEIFKMKTDELLNQPKENNFNAKNKLRYIFEFFQRWQKKKIKFQYTAQPKLESLFALTSRVASFSTRSAQLFRTDSKISSAKFSYSSAVLSSDIFFNICNLAYKQDLICVSLVYSPFLKFPTIF